MVNPRTRLFEYLYKIFSPEELTPQFLSGLLGVAVPTTFTAPPAAEHAEVVDPISWYYPHVFNSYPRALPRVTFQDPILRDGLYYTSGIESFISTMETSALMGMNVARLVVDNFMSLKTGGAVDAGRPEPGRMVSERLLQDRRALKAAGPRGGRVSFGIIKTTCIAFCIHTVRSIRLTTFPSFLTHHQPPS